MYRRQMHSVINTEKLQDFIRVLDKWRDPKINSVKTLRWDFDYTFYTDEDGYTYGDFLAVFALKTLGMVEKDLNDALRENGVNYLEESFARYFNMNQEEVRALLYMRSTFNTDKNRPENYFSSVQPRDVARTLANYVADKGTHPPDWMWYAHAYEDDSAPTLEEFVKR